MSNWSRFLAARLAIIDEMTREQRAPFDIRHAINVDEGGLRLLQATAARMNPRPSDRGDADAAAKEEGAREERAMMVADLEWAAADLKRCGATEAAHWLSAAARRYAAGEHMEGGAK